VTAKPALRSQYASAAPAMPAPETSTSVFRMPGMYDVRFLLGKPFQQAVLN
jgi:hypothetical protein